MKRRARQQREAERTEKAARGKREKEEIFEVGEVRQGRGRGRTGLEVVTGSRGGGVVWLRLQGAGEGSRRWVVDTAGWQQLHRVVVAAGR